MNAIISTTEIPMSAVCVAVPIFVVLFVAILMALRQSSMFDKPTAVVVASCVAVLCLLGMFRVVVVPTSGVVADAANDSHPLLNTILLPYAAMALSQGCHVEGNGTTTQPTSHSTAESVVGPWSDRQNPSEPSLASDR